jgi:hypothetical protein
VSPSSRQISVEQLSSPAFIRHTQNKNGRHCVQKPSESTGARIRLSDLELRFPAASEVRLGNGRGALLRVFIGNFFPFVLLLKTIQTGPYRWSSPSCPCTLPLN